MATGIPERYRPIDALPSAAAYVDATGAVLVENDPFRALRSMSGGAASIEGFTLPALFIEGDRPAVRDVLAGERRGSRRTVRALTLAGSPAPMLAEFVPIERKSGGPTVWQVTLRPSQQPDDASVELASRAAMTAGIVHDLRAPIQVVLGWASLLRRQHDDPERTERALMVIERNAELVMNLLELLLEQTRPHRTRRAPLPVHEVELAELVRAEVRAIQPLAEENGVRLSLTIDSPAVAVQGDEVQLRRVVINLLGNALKFTPRNGLIECRLWRLGGWAGIAVRDNGPGISQEFLPRVFDAFVQEPGHRLHHEEGLGLGLAVVRHLVEQHGGTVTASSAGSGRGAAFTVLLPAVPRLAAREEPTGRPLQATTCGE